MASIFTRIVQGELPAHKIAETERCLAFLDIMPVRPGHTLVIPKQEIDYFFDLPDELLAEVMTFAKKVAKAIERVVPCERIGVAVVGLEVPHAHVHLIPIRSVHDLGFYEREKADDAELAELAERIRGVYADLWG